MPLRGRAPEAGGSGGYLQPASPREPGAGTLLALGLGARLRRAEIAGLAMADVELGREAVTVRGKGWKAREVPIKGGTLRAPRAWRELRGGAAGPLLWPVGKGGRLQPRRLAAQAVLWVCEKRGREAGVPGFTAHDLRRTYISALLDAGVDLAVASELAGHAGPGTTKRYDRRSERAKQRAAEAVVMDASASNAGFFLLDKRCGSRTYATETVLVLFGLILGNLALSPHTALVDSVANSDSAPTAGPDRCLARLSFALGSIGVERLLPLGRMNPGRRAADCSYHK